MNTFQERHDDKDSERFSISAVILVLLAMSQTSAGYSVLTLGGRDFESVTPELRQNILAFYGDLALPIATKQDKEEWRKTLSALDKLKAPTNAARAQRRR